MGQVHAFEAIFSHVGAMLGHLEAIFGPRWANAATCWGYVETKNGQNHRGFLSRRRLKPK